jgi:hypothetical protein
MGAVRSVRNPAQVTLSDRVPSKTFQTATEAGWEDGTRWVTTMLDPPGGIETP